MKDSEASDEPPLPKRNLSWARISANVSNLNPLGGTGDTDPHPTLNDSTSTSDRTRVEPTHFAPTTTQDDTISPPVGVGTEDADKINKSKSATQTAPSMAAKGDGEESAPLANKAKLSVGKRFVNDVRRIISSSWINWLLIFVPIGIAFGIMTKVKGEASPISPNVVFAMNAIAIIPLAYLLCFATESVAAKLGDTMGALLNVTFGNAVELIIFIIALVAKEIRIVQASLLGSILANLLLILGMCFLFGGLRFREQLYNTAVSQMSACLLSLAVVSLLLPTAFHASFNNASTADRVVIKVSRGTSVVLLFVYILYLLFQLKSHAYMYESTPQHLIDEESHPGVLADMLNSSSSSSDSSSSDSDSDASSSSRNTTQRIKRALRRKRRKSTSSSKEVPSVPSRARSPSTQTNNNSVAGVFLKSESPIEFSPEVVHSFEGVLSGDEADDDGEQDRLEQDNTVTSRDFEHEKNRPKKRKDKAKSKRKAKRSQRCRKEKSGEEKDLEKTTDIKPIESNESTQPPPQVGFISEVQEIPDATASKRAFNLRNLSSAVRPALPKTFPANVFSQQPAPGQLLPGLGARPLPGRFNAGTVRRTTSLPEMLHGTTSTVRTTSTPQPPPLSTQPLPHLMPANQPKVSVDSKDIVDGPKPLSRTSAVLLLLASTGLVAVCAEFLVDSIDYLVQNSGISQAFVGLIILPIVGNAAEHVTAVTMASKNKMDLAINVALGSSIQIALFVTPVIVLLGWALGTDMSLYFSLFETISLFASAFIVNFLLIDGRSNYLEGALLMAAYVIIALAAFFYPTCNLSVESGPADASSSC